MIRKGFLLLLLIGVCLLFFAEQSQARDLQKDAEKITENFLEAENDLGKAGGWFDFKIMKSNRVLYVNQDCGVDDKNKDKKNSKCVEQYRPTIHLKIPMWGRLLLETDLGLKGKQDNPEMVFYGVNIGYQLTKSFRMGYTTFSELNIGSRTAHHGYQGIYGNFKKYLESGHISLTGKYFLMSDYYNPHAIIKSEKPVAAYVELEWRTNLASLFGVNFKNKTLDTIVKKLYADIKPYTYFNTGGVDHGGLEAEFGYAATKSLDIAYWHNSQHAWDRDGEGWDMNGLKLQYKF